MARTAADGLLTVVFAPECAACETPLDSPTAGPVCAACWASIRPVAPPWCPTCGAPRSQEQTAFPVGDRCAACHGTGSALDLSRVAMAYAGAARRVIHAFKYERRRSLAAPLGRALREAAPDLLTGAACAVPVPLHLARRLYRGFNQAADLAGGLGLPVVRALWRRRRTRSQVGLSASDRRRNVRGAFRPSPFLRASRRRHHIENRIVVLVDDVRTTGATLEECARVLKGMGAREVRAVALAQAPVRDGGPATSGLARFA